MNTHRRGFYEKYIKLPQDTVLALLALAILSPVLGLVTLAVRLHLGAPVLFRQERAGKDGRSFTLYKFRTMSDRRDAAGALLPDEQRLDGFGRFLRSTSLDELPSLWNVVSGSCALCGPRPLYVKYVPLYSPRQARRLWVRPGLTGLAQVSGRNAIGWEEKFSYDVRYVERITFWGDWRILFKTVRMVLRREGITAPGCATAEEFKGGKRRERSMNKRLVILGAGGHGRAVADAALKMGYRTIVFLDDRAAGRCIGFPIAGPLDRAEALRDGETDFVIALGDNRLRRRVAMGHDLSWARIVHPSAQISPFAELGAGTVVLAGAAVNVCARVGRHCIVNTGAVVEHDNVLEDFAQVAPRAALGGSVRVGALAQIGIGAVVKNNIAVGMGCIIGAGAVVVKSTEPGGVYVGVPAWRREKGAAG